MLKEDEGMIIPGGVPHMVRTTKGSIARGSNFLWDVQMRKSSNVTTTYSYRIVS